MKELEDAEVRHLEGPCWDAYQTGAQVVAGDLRDEHDRWPKTASHAIGIGLLAAYAFPLRLRDKSIGALNLYRSGPGAFGDQDVAVAQAFADIAAIGILQERKVAAGEELSGQLQRVTVACSSSRPRALSTSATAWISGRRTGRCGARLAAATASSVRSAVTWSPEGPSASRRNGEPRER